MLSPTVTVELVVGLAYIGYKCVIIIEHCACVTGTNAERWLPALSR
jgi:hypothetical protein